MTFEELLCLHRSAIERYVYYKIPHQEDAEEIMQEALLAAFQSFASLSEESKFKPWLLRIVRNKCNDYFRSRSRQPETVELGEYLAFHSNLYERFEIWDIVSRLDEHSREIFRLYYFYGLSVNEIAARLCIPAGTVKSRLHKARADFKNQYYPLPPARIKGDDKMKLPEAMPAYTITKLDKEAFSVKWEELIGWLIIPKIGEKLSWAIYDMPERTRAEVMKMEVTGKAEVHGIEGVEILAREYDPMPCNRLDDEKYAERKLIAQLTDTHCRILGEIHKQGGVTKYYTFLDEAFLKNWGYGEDNCGQETNLSPKGIIKRDGDSVVCDNRHAVLDVVGRYCVTINGNAYDTVCLMDMETYEEGVATEQYIDKNGRTVLWRRFNADDWQFDKRHILWSEKLPENERIFVNGKPYIHWYDCISEYIL